MTFEVTPWEVKGKVDYDRLVKEFGITPINEDLLKRLKKHTKDLHLFLRRKIFFAHRDLNWILDKYESGEKFYLYTGRGPTEAMHLGHLIPLIFTKWLQEKFKAKVYLQFTDDEKFLFKRHLSLEEIEKFTEDNIIDTLALGFDEKKTIVIQDVKHIHFLYKEALKVARQITFSTTKAVFGFKESSNIGQIFFTSIQSVPAFIESVLKKRNVPCLIPLGVDQDPHFRITRDVAPKLGYYKPAIMHAKFLPSLRGEEKMSSSKPEACIFLKDGKEVVKKKVWRATTGGGGSLKEHKEKGGNPDVCRVYHYISFLLEENDKKLKERYIDCKSGNITCGECKEYLSKKIISFFEKHKKMRKKVKPRVKNYLIDAKVSKI